MERLQAAVTEQVISVAVARSAVALAFVLAGRLPRHLEFGRRDLTELALAPLTPEIVADLGLNKDAAMAAIAALVRTGILWREADDRVTLRGDVLDPLFGRTEASSASLLDVSGISIRLDAVLPETTRGTRERKAAAWFVIAAVAAATTNQPWVALPASAFRPPLSFDASTVRKVIRACVDAGVLEAHAEQGRTTLYRLALPSTAPTRAGSSTPASESKSAAVAFTLDVRGAHVTVAVGAHLAIDPEARCRVTRDPATGLPHFVIE